MRTIPLSLRKHLANDPRMAVCAVCSTRQDIQWHHPLVHAGRQINEEYGLIALCRTCHTGDNGTIPQYNRDICELKAIVMGLQSDLETKYPKVNWRQRKDWLTRKIVLNK